MGSCPAWPPPCGVCTKSVSARLNPRNGTIDVRGVCNFLSSVSSQQKLEAMDQHYSPWMGQCYSSWTDQCHSSRMDQCYSSVLQLSFIQKIKENTPWRYEGMPTQKTQRERERREASSPLAPLFICLFLLPLGLPYVNWTSQECCLFYLRFSLQSLDLPLFYFRGLFPLFSFSHCHSRLLFPILTT